MIKIGSKVCHIGSLEHGIGEVIEIDENNGNCEVVFKNASFTGVSSKKFALVSELSPEQKDSLTKVLSKQAQQRNRFKPKQKTPSMKLQDKAFVVIGGIFFLFFIMVVIRELSGSGIPCNIQYEKAWAACNNDYNGKCAYLGPKYKPSCSVKSNEFYRN
ncbi:conserved hypothetical protein [Alteromonas sp. 38]|uniref:hypothetical protein n=1 Tax=unclassified Alteromonas TaxID=2614992 RepID=UPI0012F3C054|nr:MULTISPECIES: hypothetical protein [unclassified Alteromonas]CAD5273017.1 conserved hypothetical protein [Alteromonas sp. 154]VXB54846.1 conserved hypothetical protein [Alteromonas sp. 38]